MRTRFIGIAGIALTALVLIGAAHADAIFSVGNTGTDVANLVCCVGGFDVADPGTSLHGAVANIGGVPVEVTSEVNRLTATAGGSTIEGQNKVINNIALLPCFSDNSCFSFKIIKFTLFKPTVADLMIEAFTCTPGPTPTSPCTDSKDFAISNRNGEDWTITAVNNEVIWNVVVNSAAGFQEVKNIRFSNGPGTVFELPEVPSPPGPAIIPEPSSMLLLGSGVLGLAQLLRRKLSRGGGVAP